MRRVRLLWLVLALVVTGPAGGGETPLSPAATPGDDANDELIAQEKIRAAFESILEIYFQPISDGDERIEMAIQSAESLQSLGPEVVPYLSNELDRGQPGTLDLCSYALGLLTTEEAEAALRRAIERAEEATGTRARLLKSWACWGLGLQGKADAMELAVGGKHSVATFHMHANTSLLETIAIQTAPDSVPVLLALLERVQGAEESARVLTVTLQALRRVGGPAVAPKVIPLLDHPSGTTRSHAASALKGMGSAAAVRALVAALDDELPNVRQSVALALEYIGSASHQEEILKHLETEADPVTRGALYRLLADTAGEQAFDVLTRDWQSADPTVRSFLVEALGLLDDPRRFEILGTALSDENNGVALRSVLTLGRIEGQVAIATLTGAVTSARLNVARAAAEQLGGLRATLAGPAIARRLVGDVLAGPATDTRLLLPVQKMTAALIRLDHYQALPQLREALARQTNPTVARVLENSIRQLEIVQQNGKDVARWIETAGLPQLHLRLLAYDHLGRIGNAAATQALLAAFDRVEAVPERVEILRAAGQLESAEVVKLLGQILLKPEFDPVRRLPLRDMAAWSARQRGGDTMYESLQAAALRRDGRDARVLVYAALVGGQRALPLLESLRKPRMRYLGWRKGAEQNRLDWVATRLATGRALVAVDVPPEKLTFR
jgi:HEAT repeat protein